MKDSLYQNFKKLRIELNNLATEYYTKKYPIIKNNNILIRGRTNCSIGRADINFFLVEDVRAEPYNRWDYTDSFDKNLIEKTYQYCCRNTCISNGKGKSEGWFNDYQYTKYTYFCTLEEFEEFNKTKNITTGLTRTNLLRFYNYKNKL